MTLAMTVDHLAARAAAPSAPPGTARVARPAGVGDLDRETLEACRAGEAAAIRAFIEHYQGLVFAFVSRSLGRGPHVEDLAQEVFLRACRALPREGGDGRGARVSTWLLTIASRLVIDARRKRQIPTTALETEVDPPADGTPETERARLELGRALEAAAAALPAEQRDVFILVELHGLDMKESASVLGIPEGTVKTRLFRARAELRVLLRGVWDGLDGQEEP